MTPPDLATTNPKKGSEIFRPYARLISILGDQLITNKWVGVIELVKNCYDADAEEVSVRFLNFDVIGQSPVIEIEDDGDGMTLDTILNVWMKPATPNKLNKKKSDIQRFTKKGRLMQGDKGVGRFAVYKLGNYVEIFTKTENTPEVRLELNFRDYAQDDEFADKTEIPEKFLDQVKNEWQINDTPTEIKNDKGKGTLIRISDFRNDWKYDDLNKLAIAFSRMIPPVIPNLKGEPVKDFNVKLFWNETEYKTRILDFETIMKLAPFSFQGSIDIKGNLLYEYKHNKKEIFEEINLFNVDDSKKHDVWNLKLFKEQFLEENDSKSILIRKNGNKVSPQSKSKWKVRRLPEIGDFSFFFFAFDWKNKSDIDQEQESFIKDNSVYLYRDFTRVYPYGEKGIDWLMLSKLRAEDRAGMYFSYNDLIGFIFISQKYNPKLRDAANREGLVNIDGAYDDFVTLIQAALKVMKDHVTVDKRRDELEKEKAFTTANQKFSTAFDDLKKELVKLENEKVLLKAQKLFTVTNQLVAQYKERLTIAQELAGVGMAVEKSSHDLSLLIRKIIQNATDITNRFSKGKLPASDLKNFVEDLIKNLEFLYEEIQILQPLFRVARKVTKDISVKETIERVQRYFRRELLNNINFKIEGSTDILVKTNMGLMLQVFINLMDNAVYWLNQKNSGKREIIVKIDNSTNSVIFADSGFGISEELAEFIFLEFYSMKADGRGLGLYIVKELLDRIDAKISLITQEDLKILPGANFLIQFNEVK